MTLMVDPNEAGDSKFVKCLAVASSALLLFIIVAAIVPQFVSFAYIKSQLDSYSGDGSADAFTVEIDQRVRQALFGFAVFNSLLLAIGWWHYRKINAFLIQIFHQWRLVTRKSFDRHLVSLRWMCLVGATLSLMYAGVVSQFMNGPIRYDEAHTYLNYVSQPVFMTVTQYDAPNNHILYSLAAKASIAVFGDSVQSLRTPALLSGCLLVVVVLVGGWCYCHPVVGVTAALLLISNPTFIEAGANARGHITGALFLSLAVLAIQWSCNVKYRGLPLVLCSIAIALALYTVPTTLYGVFLIFIWSMLQTYDVDWHHRLPSRALGSPAKLKISACVQSSMAFIGGGVAAILLYLPILLTNSLDQIASVATSQRASPIELLTEIPAYIKNTWAYYAWDLPTAINWMLIVFTFLMLLSPLYSRAYPHSSTFPSHMTRVYIATAGLLALVIVHRTLPPERTLIFVVPLWTFLIANWSYDSCGKLLSADVSNVPTVFAAIIFAATSWHTLNAAHIQTSERHAVVREGHTLASWLHEHAASTQPIIAVTPESATIVYFFHKQAWGLEHFLVPQRDANYDEGALVLTHDAFQSRPVQVLEELNLQKIFDGEHPTLMERLGNSRVWHVNQHRFP
jgi:hypothetical protein